MKCHHYQTALTWTGNLGQGTTTYRTYTRDHEILVEGKTITIPGSSDPAFRGDPSRYNPEELFVASLSACHMLWFLHLCSTNQIVVSSYTDQAIGMMEENEDGSGQFKEVTLHPHVTVTAAEMLGNLDEIHKQAHQMCFIARSCNFPVRCEGAATVG